MIYPSIDKILNQVGSKYLLINVVSRRAKEIEATGHLQMKETEYKCVKPIGMAMEEVSKGLIHIQSEEK